MILSSHVSDEKIFLFFSLLGNSIPNLVRLSGQRRAHVTVWEALCACRRTKPPILSRNRPGEEASCENPWISYSDTPRHTWTGVLPSSSPLARLPWGETSRGSLSRSVARRTGCFPVPQGTC